MKNNKDSLPKSKRVVDNYRLETGMHFVDFLAPQIDLGKFNNNQIAMRNLNDRTTRKIIVNGEEVLINNRQDDPNP